MKWADMKKRGGILAVTALMLLVFAGSAWSVWSYEIIYSGRNVVDFHFGALCSDKVKCELLRDANVIQVWEDTTEDIYYSDSSVPVDSTRYLYTFKRYGWDDGNQRWYELSTEETWIDTWIVQGTLHNGSEWLTKLRRGAVDWYSSSGTYFVKYVMVEDGQLFIGSGTKVSFIEAGPSNIVIAAGASLWANRAIFERSGDVTGSVGIELTGQVPRAYDTFAGCRLIDVSIAVANSQGVRMIGNSIVMSSTNELVRFEGLSDSTIENNTGNATLTVVTGQNNTIRNNKCTWLNAEGTNLIEGNECNRVVVYGAATVKGNLIKMFQAYEGSPVIENNVITGDADSGDYDGRLECYLCENALIKGNTVRNFVEKGISLQGGRANRVEGNLVEAKQEKYDYSSAGIYLWDSNENMIKANNVLGIYGRGIHLYRAKNNNIEYNAINKSTLEGIFLENTDNYCNPDGSSSDNVIAFNHIWRNAYYGIHAHHERGCHKRNGIHDNIISTNGIGVKLGSTNDDNVVYNNLFRGNSNKNAQDDGTNNRWYHDKVPVNQNIVGGPWLAGNYWHDYTGVDSDGDGIGDTPYPIMTSGASPVVRANDIYPLKPPVAPDPDIVVDRNALTFETTAIGTFSNVITVTVRNTGSADLSLWQVAVGGTDPGDFVVQNDLCSNTSLAHEGSCAFGVAFRPFTAGVRSAKVVIPSDDPGTPETEVTLSGTGQQLVPYEIVLGPGWNFLSSPITPGDNSVGAVFGVISNTIDIMWGFDNQSKAWKRWVPGGPMGNNSLQNFLSENGYWIHTNGNAAVTMADGRMFRSFSLGEGWYLVGYPGEDRDISQGLLPSIEGKWAVIWGWENGAWKAKVSQGSLPPSVSGLTTLKKGGAYWVKMKKGMSGGWIQ
jgi:parallel beta-helix repeat protein